MSHVYQALKKSRGRGADLIPPTNGNAAEEHVRQQRVGAKELTAVEVAPGGEPPRSDRLQGAPTEEVAVDVASRVRFHSEPQGAAADRFRFLRMRLRDLRSAKNLRRILVTSPLPREGKSTLAVNLATALAENGKRTVLLVEADLHHPTVTRQLDLKTGPGLAECLQTGLDPLSAVRRLEPLGFYLLPGGGGCDHATELLQSDALPGVMQTLSDHFEWIVIDSPPVVPLTDTLSLAKQADAVLLVVRAGSTPREAVEQSIALLGRERVAGIVLNAVHDVNRLYSKYYGHYDGAAKR
jgi:capsular exopolysaccharide synthesis family protein